MQETLLTATSERQGRVIDKDEGGAGMEKKKAGGVFLMSDTSANHPAYEADSADRRGYRGLSRDAPEQAAVAIHNLRQRG